MTAAWSPDRTGAETDRTWTDQYGEGFAAVYASTRYTLFSQQLAKLALALIATHGAPGRDLLDLACGPGAGTAVFAAAGYTVSGVDRSPTMLDLAAERLRAEGHRACLVRQEMQSLALPHPVDVVACLFDSLNYLLVEEDVARVFARVRSALRPDGLFVFDMNTPHGLATRWGTRDVLATARPDLVEMNRYRYDAATGVNTVTSLVFVRDAGGELFQRHTEVHRERGYPTEAVFGLLQRAGLEVLAGHGIPDQFRGVLGGLQPLDAEAGRIMVVARRRC